MSDAGNIIEFLYSKLITRLNPRDKNLWLYGAWFGKKYIDNTKYFFISNCREKDGIRHVWITDDVTIKNELNSQGYECYLKDSPEGKKLQMQAGVFVCTQGVSDFNKYLVNNAVIINLWHGIPLKKILHDDKIAATQKRTIKSKIYHLIMDHNGNETYVVSSSDRITEIYRSAFQKDIEHILQFGQPRNDIFYDTTLIDTKMSMWKNKKAIVYMPTHRLEGRTEIDVAKLFNLDKLDAFCEKNNCVFVIKKHFYHRNEKVAGIERYRNIIDITTTAVDPQILLKNTDLLICDYSSAYIDFLLLDRPIVFYNYDLENYLVEDREMYFDYDEVAPGPQVRTFDELYDVLQHEVVEKKDTYKTERDRVRNVFYAPEAQRAVGTLLYEKIKELLR